MSEVQNSGMKIKEVTFTGSSSNYTQGPKQKAPEFAFIGRSNVGKSSLINAICERKDLARTSAMPGKTVLINHFIVNNSWYLVDLPGYGFAKISKKEQAALKKMIEGYVSKSENLAILFVLLDSRHDLQEIDRNFITAIAGANVNFAIILTKCDKLSNNELARNKARLTKALADIKTDVPIIATSSEKKVGREEVLSLIENYLTSSI